jgi:hypothetical protein
MFKIKNHPPTPHTSQNLPRARFVLTALATTAAVLSAAQAGAQDLPTPFALASQLDLECHAAEGQPPVPSVWIRQLNPVLQDQLPNQQAVLGGLEDVCVPVEKNEQTPGPAALAIARWVDLACYEASAPPVNVGVNLTHLNPVLANLPDENVTVVGLEQLCVPVRKNDSEIPPLVRQIVSQFDFACYALEEPTSAANTPLVLSHLNPVIRDMQLDDRAVTLRRAHQLCVPIAKGNQVVPPAALELVRWVDFLRYRLTPASAAAIPAVQAPIPLVLTHLNPLFDGVEPFFTVLQAPLELLVPVAKNGVFPPGGAGAD